MTGSAGAAALPRWLCVAGWVSALLQLTAVFWVVTVLALPVWVLLAGIAMLRSDVRSRVPVGRSTPLGADAAV